MNVNINLGEMASVADNVESNVVMIQSKSKGLNSLINTSSNKRNQVKVLPNLQEDPEKLLKVYMDAKEDLREQV